MKKLCFVSTLFAIVFSITLPAFSEEQNAATVDPLPAESVTARVDKLFAQWNKSDSPGCSLGVSRNGVVLYEHGYGMANLELGVPITAASVFDVASISKPFTAMSILLLAQRGQISLDDEARKYITELPDYGSRLTIRHLLNHTSGLRDVYLLRELAAPTDDRGDRNDALVKLLARQRALNFAPGTEYQYNNGGYVLLATIVKRVSGQSLREFADANIFKPLGMRHTQFNDNPTVTVRNRVSGYFRDAGELRIAIHGNVRGAVGNTGLLTTARDLLLWQQNFADVRVGDPALLSEMQTPTRLTGGRTNSYGLGLEIGEHRGLRTVGHGGGGGGFGAYVVRYPDQGLGIAVLCNLEEMNSAVVELTRRVADIYLADVFTTPSASNKTVTPPHVSLSAEQLASKVGLYRDPSNETLGDFVRIVVRDGKLTAVVGAGDTVELTPVNASRFIVPGTAIALEFVPAATGRPQELHVIGAAPKPEVLQQVTAFARSKSELRAFAGQYRSGELDVTYTLTTRDSGLVMQIPGRADVVLQPIFPDAFHASGLVDVVKFLRDARSVVTGCRVHASGVRSLRFDRVKR